MSATQEGPFRCPPGCSTQAAHTAECDRLWFAFARERDREAREDRERWEREDYERAYGPHAARARFGERR
jgi:hypothetical protein